MNCMDRMMLTNLQDEAGRRNEGGNALVMGLNAKMAQLVGLNRIPESSYSIEVRASAMLSKKNARAQMLRVFNFNLCSYVKLCIIDDIFRPYSTLTFLTI